MHVRALGVWVLCILLVCGNLGLAPRFHSLIDTSDVDDCEPVPDDGASMGTRHPAYLTQHPEYFAGVFTSSGHARTNASGASDLHCQTEEPPSKRSRSTNSKLTDLRSCSMGGSARRVKYTSMDRMKYLSALDAAFDFLLGHNQTPTLAAAIRQALAMLSTPDAHVTRLERAIRRWYNSRVLIGWDTPLHVVAEALGAAPRQAWFPEAEVTLMTNFRAGRRKGQVTCPVV